MTDTELEAYRQALAAHFKTRRETLGISQYKMAELTGLARKTIIAMEQGKFWLGMQQYVKICEALQLVPGLPVPVNQL